MSMFFLIKYPNLFFLMCFLIKYCWLFFPHYSRCNLQFFFFGNLHFLFISSLYLFLYRVAKAWMDDYASFYFKMNARARAAADRQDVSQRLAQRRQLACRSFAWYLDTVWPEHFLPRPGRFFGRLESAVQPGRCLQKPARRPGSHSSQPTGPAGLQAGRLYVATM